MGKLERWAGRWMVVPADVRAGGESGDGGEAWNAGPVLLKLF